MLKDIRFISSTVSTNFDHDYSRWIKIYFLKHNSEIKDVFLKFKAEAEN